MSMTLSKFRDKEHGRVLALYVVFTCFVFVSVYKSSYEGIRENPYIKFPGHFSARNDAPYCSRQPSMSTDPVIPTLTFF
jgi:hypothetical protein